MGWNGGDQGSTSLSKMASSAFAIVAGVYIIGFLIKVVVYTAAILVIVLSVLFRVAFGLIAAVVGHRRQ